MTRGVKYLLILFLVTITTVFAVYAGLHFVGSATTGFGSFKATIDVSGFGSDTSSVLVSVNLSGSNLTAWCQNKGGNRAPGQNAVSVNISSSQTATVNKNGRSTANFKLSILPTATAAGCPNNNWKVTDVVGVLTAVFTATDLSSGDSVSQTYTCNIDEPQKTVTCVRTS